jgi:hypothetical protein
MGEYEHRQYGWIWIPLLLLGLAVPIWTRYVTQGHPQAGAILWLTLIPGVIIALAGLMFVYLDVRDEGDRLVARFGLLPLWGTSVSYDDIETVEPMATSLLHGLGVHGCPGWFLVCNIAGSDAVRIHRKGRRGLMRVKTVIIGTDDAENLLAFLRGKIGAGQSGMGA